MIMRNHNRMTNKYKTEIIGGTEKRKNVSCLFDSNQGLMKTYPIPEYGI